MEGQALKRFAVAMAGFALMVTGCGADQPVGGRPKDADAVCGVVTKEAFEAAVGAQPSRWSTEFASRADRLRSLGDACTVTLSRGDVLIVTREAESAAELERLRSSLDAEPRCDRAERLDPSGWLCETSALLTVQSTTDHRRLSFTFGGGAGGGMTKAQAEDLVRSVDDGLDTFDAS